MELVPTGKAEVEKLATSFVRATLASNVEPLKKSTSPEGGRVPVLAWLTVAVNSTFVP
jgi:hypothetical protein